MEDSFVPDDPRRFNAALRRFDEENGSDPNRQLLDGVAVPWELWYAQVLSDWVLRLKPDASESLRLAARCAHLCRWVIPRESYPMTRAGYLQWRQELKKFHARRAGEILREVGYEPEAISRVQALVSKTGFPAEAENRILEDALCLVFLEHQFANLAERTTDEKVINAIHKAWKKMSPAAQGIALTLRFGPREKSLLDRALSKEE